MAAGRVTEGSITTAVRNNLQRSIQKGQTIQEQLSSGKMINRPSDSPTGTVTSMALRGESRAVQQYSRNADDGVGWLSTLDSTLTNTSTLLNRARDLTVQGLDLVQAVTHTLQVMGAAEGADIYLVDRYIAWVRYG